MLSLILHEIQKLRLIFVYIILLYERLGNERESEREKIKEERRWKGKKMVKGKEKGGPLEME